MACTAPPLPGSGFHRTAGSCGKEMKSRSVFPSSPHLFTVPSSFPALHTHTQKTSRGFPCQAKLDAIQNRNAGEGKRKKKLSLHRALTFPSLSEVGWVLKRAAVFKSCSAKASLSQHARRRQERPGSVGWLGRSRELLWGQSPAQGWSTRVHPTGVTTGAGRAWP